MGGCWPLFLPLEVHCYGYFLVEDIDLGFLRNREDIENDKRVFLNDSEWQLLSVSSTYHILRSSVGNFAQIRFNVGSPSYLLPMALQSMAFSIELWNLLYCISSLSPENSVWRWLCPFPCEAVFESRGPELWSYHRNLQGNQREWCAELQRSGSPHSRSLQTFWLTQTLSHLIATENKAQSDVHTISITKNWKQNKKIVSSA